MKSLFRTSFAILALLSGALAGSAQESALSVSATKERIGVYDSRAVAVAFAGTPMHEARLRSLRERREQAEKTGDAAGVAKIEAEGRELQRKAHQQAFSTAPVDEILAELGPVLPDLQRKAGVTLLVSKWDEAELQKHLDAERVDVTLQLIDALHPNERQRRSAIEIQKHKPIPLERAAASMD